MKTLKVLNLYSQISANAKILRAELDTTNLLSDSAGSKMLTHLRDCIDNPAMGMLVRSEQKKSINYPGFYEAHLKQILKDPKVKKANDVYERKLIFYYPRTLTVRNYMLDNKNVVFNYVKKKSDGIMRKLFKFFISI